MEALCHFESSAQLGYCDGFHRFKATIENVVTDGADGVHFLYFARVKCIGYKMNA